MTTKYNFPISLSALYQTLLVFLIFVFSSIHVLGQVNPSSRISDSPTTIIGFNHISLSVKDLDKMLSFYQEATEFELVKRERISHNKNADILHGVEGLSYESATLRAPNMYLEINQYSDQQKAESKKMPPHGPGMTHTCYQSASWNPGYSKFLGVGAELLSRGNGPVDIGGYGVTYAYAYDPEGNMIEMEQLDQNVLDRVGLDSLWLESNPMWMTQVALISSNLSDIVEFYQMVLDIPPARKGDYVNHPKLNDIIDVDSASLLATWFTMDGYGKMLELMEYRNPKTESRSRQLGPTDLGYSFSFEVEDIQEEYVRLKQLGVEFMSQPMVLGEFITVFANDIDGNVFSLRQPVIEGSKYSIKNTIPQKTD